MDALVAAAPARAATLARRDYRREGIEMLLTLSNLNQNPDQSEPPSPDDPYGCLLADATERVAARLLRGEERDPVRALRGALEVVAADLFTPEPFEEAPPLRDAPDPAASGDGRPPLRLGSALDEELRALTKALRGGRYLRALNFHITPRTDAARYERRLRAVGERFASVSEASLRRLAAGEPWWDARPPALLAFFEGTRDGYDVAAPLLEKAGLRGMFFLIPGFLDAPASEQRAFAAAHHIALAEGEYAPRERVAMSWDEVRDLETRGHSVACHTMTHAEPRPDTPIDRLREESVGAVSRLEEELGHGVKTFTWLRGVPWGVEPRADRLLLEAGVEVLISTFEVEVLPRG